MPLTTTLLRLAPLAAAAALAACSSPPAAPPAAARTAPLACDDGLKTAFRPDARTQVIAVRAIRAGEALVAVDSPQPITAAGDMCLVKLLVGPGATAEKDRNAKSWSEGIGIEVWLPAHARWNQRIRNYGGGGWVGGGHRTPGQIGSKVPALVNANMGFVSGTTDAGQPWYQDGSFGFLSDGRVNVESLRAFSVDAMIEQAEKTQALAALYYGQPARYRYYDGHSQGGRQGLKVMQVRPELYDGYLIAQPAISIPHFGTAGLYPQLAMQAELGFNALDKPRAAALAAKVQGATRRAVAACDRTGLGFLLDPFACAYNPARDAQLLCAGEAGDGVTGTSTDRAACMTRKEADVLNRAWYGATRDGRFDAAQTDDGRAGRRLGPQQLWWGFSRGTGIGGQFTGAGADQVALALQDVRYASDARATGGIPITNTSTAERNRWQTLDYAGLADVQARSLALQDTLFARLGSDDPDLRRLRDLGRKVIVHSGLADDAIPVSGNVAYHEKVVATMGGHEAVQAFLRMYLVPGAAHSSQGRPFAANGDGANVPLPKLPGNANQNPTREQDQFFTALQDWVEAGRAPGEIVVTSRNGQVSLPLCVYPKKITWNGTGSPKAASSYACR